MRKNPRSAWRQAGLPLAAALLLVTAAAQAQWKWRDDRGQIHVSDLPPPRTVPDNDVLQRPELAFHRPAPSAPAASAAAAASAARPAGVDSELEAKKRLAEQQKAAKEKAEQDKLAALRRDNCNRARDQLTTLQSGQRIARVKADGEREIMSDQQRAAEVARARALMASDCR